MSKICDTHIELPLTPDRHHERIGDELRGHRRTHGPADHKSREEIDAAAT